MTSVVSRGPAGVVVDACNRSIITPDFVSDTQAAGINVVGRTILVSSTDVFSPFGFEESLREIVQLREQVSAYPDRLMMVDSVADIATAVETGRTGFYVYFQSPEPLSNQPWRLDLFRALGLRVLQLTYNQRSLLGDGCSEPEDGGLSEYGVEVVRRCNELGITVDLAHCGPRTTREGVESSTKPVLLSHTGARSVFEHPRAKSDELMQACAQRGGVIGVVGMASLIGGVGSTIDNVLDHVEYIARLVGVDHVGFGLDFITGHERDNFGLLGYKPEMYQEEFMTGQSSAVTGLATIKDMTSLRDGLLHRGFGSADVGLILGGNFVRVFTETW